MAAAMAALADVMSPKSYLKDIVGELDYQYPCYGVPEAFFFDRGSDFDNGRIRDVVNEFHIRIDYEPVGCPNFKGAIERWHRTLKEEVDHPLPGATPPGRKGEFRRDSNGKAYITLSEYIQRVWRWVTMVYMKSPHRGLRTTPLKAWRDRSDLRLPRPLPSRDSLRPLLTRSELLTPRNTGVQFSHLRWNGNVLRYIRALPEYRPGTKVDVRINDQNLEEAWVINPVTREWEKLEPVSPEYMKGLTLYQHRMAKLTRTLMALGTRRPSSRLGGFLTRKPRHCLRGMARQAERNRLLPDISIAKIR